jgi:translation initiation factor IF-2
MGKVRVYELAKELNLGNKELVLKLQEMGYPVKSHSSTIEEFLLREIRERLQGPGARTAPTLKGEKPTVIRRRKKVVEPERQEEPSVEAGAEVPSPDRQPDASLIPTAAPEVEVEGKMEAIPEETLGPVEKVEPVKDKPVAAEEKKEVVDTKVEAVAIELHPEKFVERPVEPPLIDGSTVGRRPEEQSIERALDQPEVHAVERPVGKTEEGPAAEKMPVEGGVSAEAKEKTAASEAKTAESEPAIKAGPEPGVKKEAKDKKAEAPRKRRKRKKLKKIEKTTAEPAKIISRPTMDQPLPHQPAAELLTKDEQRQVERAPEPAPKPSPKPPQKPSPKPGPRPDHKPGPRPDHRPAPRSDHKPAPRPDHRPAPRPDHKPAPSRGGASFGAAGVGMGSDILDRSAESRKSKKKKKGKEFTSQVEDFGRKKSFRRKEVIEKAELYEKNGWDRPSRGRKAAKSAKKAKRTEITVPKAIKRRIKVVDAISVSDLAKKMGIKAGDIIKKLMAQGVMANLNQALDFDTAALVAAEFDYEVEKGSFNEEQLLDIRQREESEKEFRPPVVTVMGHVDHGKTSLLDAIRHTDVIGGEAGGITQHIGAYHVSVNGGSLTFLDTPGHEAFTSMRARGAKVTDIVILVVAADDGVMQQTREAADHAKAADVPILIAVNKIDKPGATPDRIRRELADIGIVPESWGGDTIFVDISAKTGQGIDELIEMILLQSEVMELKASKDGRARGHIIEARLDKGRGPVATVLVREGTLKQGDPFVCGVWNGKVRAMFDDKGNRVEEAGPSIPVEIQGIVGVPSAGDEFVVVEDEKAAKQISQHRQLRQRENELIKTSKLTLENLFDSIKEGAAKELNIVLKADVQGSLEAIADAVHKLDTEEIKINIIHSSTGAISETDIMLASASEALVIGFNVRPNAKVSELAEQESIQIRFYDVIYKLIDEVRDAMAGMLAPIQEEHVLGRAEVRDVFHIAKVGTIAGSSVLDGKVQRGANARLLRDDVVIYDGKINSLKRFKEDAKEVVQGYECGIGLENYNDIKVGDVVEAYLIEEVAATLG